MNVTPAGAATGVVRCPICLDVFRWDPADDGLFAFSEEAGYVPLRIPADASPEKRAGARRLAHLRCPNPSGDRPAHFLPLLYTAYRPPIVIGLVGASLSGKTHLLAAMMGEIENDRLAAFDLKADALDPVRHRTFMRQYTRPLLEKGRRLPGTVEGVADFADALLISSATGTWPVAFFDIGGEDLSRLRDNTRFLNGVTALMFVVDAETVGAGGNARDDTYRAVLGMLHPGSGHLDVPAAVVLNKADLIRFEPPVDAWIHRPPADRLDAGTVLAESRDVYAYLHRAGATALLQPYRYCRRCTLHFASATGARARDGEFPHGVRPMRVLEPLVALLAMSGVFGAAAARQVGS
ncbi:hypothetical protein AB0M36_23265 [Actinoplanes sp. NPDC051346]|uniref:hypothetical protein n=1 Tax=Actinoplanes sp. NPDC051346 TaxID=3155048 RepID=UPI00343EAAB6